MTTQNAQDIAEDILKKAADAAKDSVTITNPKVDAESREKLITARIGLLLRAPFFGNLATRLTLVNADSWCPTAATDGRKFYYNSEFIKKLPAKQVEFLFGHEVLHNVYDHLSRRGDRDPKLSNIAQDYCVNADLIDQRIGDKITVVDILYDKKYAGWSWEEVYDDLFKNAKKIDIDQMLKQMVDEHLDGEGENDGEGAGEGKDGKSGGRPSVSEEERKKIRDEIKEAMIQAAQAAGAGNLPANVQRMIKDLTEPQMDWRELLQQQIESVVKSDFSWMRPSRRSWHMDAIMPGMIPGNRVDVTVAIDTSGSITDNDIKLFLSEVKGIMDAYDDYNINIFCWDTSVHAPAKYSPDNMTDITEYVPGGGGGTDPHCIWNYLKDNEIEPKKLVVFTDFCFWGWEPKQVEDYCDTVWIIKDNKDAQPEFGVFAHYAEAAKK
jgi:predicted metal-dependent peptidase